MLSFLLFSVDPVQFALSLFCLSFLHQQFHQIAKLFHVTFLDNASHTHHTQSNRREKSWWKLRNNWWAKKWNLWRCWWKEHNWEKIYHCKRNYSSQREGCYFYKADRPRPQWSLPYNIWMNHGYVSDSRRMLVVKLTSHLIGRHSRMLKEILSRPNISENTYQQRYQVACKEKGAWNLHGVSNTDVGLMGKSKTRKTRCRDQEVPWMWTN